MPPGPDVSIRFRCRSAVLAPFVPGAVHLAAQVDDGTAETVPDQQFAKIVELRVVLSPGRRHEVLAGRLEVALRGYPWPFVQQGSQFGGGRWPAGSHRRIAA